jgi:hypothetical protein
MDGRPTYSQHKSSLALGPGISVILGGSMRMHLPDFHTVSRNLVSRPRSHQKIPDMPLGSTKGAV